MINNQRYSHRKHRELHGEFCGAAEFTHRLTAGLRLGAGRGPAVPSKTRAGRMRSHGQIPRIGAASSGIHSTT